MPISSLADTEAIEVLANDLHKVIFEDVPVRAYAYRLYQFGWRKLEPHKLTPTGDAHRHKLVAESINLHRKD